MKKVYGDYVVKPSTTDPDKILKWVKKKLPVLAEQVWLMNRVHQDRLDLDTLQFIVHTTGEPGVTIGWKCYEKEVMTDDGEGAAGADGGVSGGAAAVR